MLSNPGQAQGRETPRPAAPPPLSRGLLAGGGVIFREEVPPRAN